MEPSILDIRTWMLTDKLKRDDGKTEFTLMRMKQQLSKVNIDSLTVGSIDVVDVTVARNLGLWFDSYLNLQEQIHNTFPQYSAYPKVSVSRIYTHFGRHAIIIGRLDDCNSLPFGLPSVHLLKLQTKPAECSCSAYM